MTWQIAFFVLYFLGVFAAGSALSKDYDYYLWELELYIRKQFRDAELPAWLAQTIMFFGVFFWPIGLVVELFTFNDEGEDL